MRWFRRRAARFKTLAQLWRDCAPVYTPFSEPGYTWIDNYVDPFTRSRFVKFLAK